MLMVFVRQCVDYSAYSWLCIQYLHCFERHSDTIVQYVLCYECNMALRVIEYIYIYIYAFISQNDEFEIQRQLTLQEKLE